MNAYTDSYFYQVRETPFSFVLSATDTEGQAEWSDDTRVFVPDNDGTVVPETLVQGQCMNSLRWLRLL